MLDIVFPRNNEKELAEMAASLGYDEIVFAYDEQHLPRENFEFRKLKTRIAVLNPKNPLKARKNADMLVADKDARHCLEKTDIDIVFGLEAKEKRDFMKQRNSGLNHILCAIASRRGKTYGLDFRDVLMAKNRADIIGKMMQNMMLCRKYRVRTIIFSGATEPFEMRNYRDMKSFFEMMGRR